MMRMYKIIDAVIPTMYNSPCRIAIFTDGVRCKVFQKDFGNWYRNRALEALGTSSKIECKIREINEYAKRGANR